MKLLYAGVDTLDFAIKGAVAREDLERLQTAKELAVTWQASTLTEIGPRRLSVHVSEHGRKGGFAFVLNTGPLGAIYAIKENDDATQWNVFVSLRASTLAVYGYPAARVQIFDELSAMGCHVNEVSISRIDYAMDFLAPVFELDTARFVAHPHTKVSPFYSGKVTQDDQHPHAIFRGRKVESVTIGKMPGRQVIVYNKRRAAIQKRELFWFELWGTKQGDAESLIWRVEVRAGKRELKDRWQIRTFELLDAHLGDLVRDILSTVRYLDTTQTDTNISRQRLDPLWIAANAAASRNLAESTNGIVPSRFKELERAKAVSIYEQQVTGNLAGLAAARGLSDNCLEEQLPRIVSKLVGRHASTSQLRLQKSVNRARQRLHFITTTKDSYGS